MKVVLRHPTRVIGEVLPPTIEPIAAWLLADEIMGALISAGWIDEDAVRGMEAPTQPIERPTPAAQKVTTMEGEWRHLDGSLCVAGAFRRIGSTEFTCAEGGGPVALMPVALLPVEP